MVPIVHVNVLEELAVRVIFGLVPLQIVAVAGLVTEGMELTVTVIVKGDPTQDPATEVGVTIY